MSARLRSAYSRRVRLGVLVVLTVQCLPGTVLGVQPASANENPVLVSGRALDPRVNPDGSLQRAMAVDQPASDLVAEFGLDPKAEIAPVASWSMKASRAVRLNLFDGATVDLMAGRLFLTTLPIFNQYLTVSEWGQTVSWSTDGNDPNGSAVGTLTLARTSSTPWRLVGGTIETGKNEYLVEYDFDHEQALVIDAPYNDGKPEFDNFEAPPARQVNVGTDVSTASTPGNGVMSIASTPTPGTRVDVLAVAANGVLLPNALFYVASGLNDMTATLANSSSPGFETANASMALVGVISLPYTQAGVQDQDVWNLESGNAGLAGALTARNLVAADLVALIVPNQVQSSPTSVCGQGRPAGWASVETIETSPSCQNRKAVTHELGHNLGAGHENATMPYLSDSFAYPAGTTASACSVVHTTTGCRKLIYSTPYRSFPGTTTVAGSASRFNAHVVSDLLPVAAAFRTPVAPFGRNYTAVPPTRVLDTRPPSSVGGYNTPFAVNTARSVAIAGLAGVPLSATAVAITVTVVSPSGNGYLSVYPNGTSWPGTSTMNYNLGQVKAATAIVQLGGFGHIAVLANSTTDVVIDVVGYFGGSVSSTNKLGVLTPTRVYDSRTLTIFGNNEPRSINTISAGVPSGAVAAVVNITVVGSTLAGFVSVGSGTSTLNYPAGGAVASNMAIAPLSGTNINVYVSASTHVIIDVLAYLGPSGVHGFTAMPPVRLNAGTSLPAGYNNTQVANIAGIPANAGAVVANVTGVFPTLPTYLTTFPAGTSLPGISTVNVAAGQVDSNHTIVGVGSSYSVTTFNPAGTITYILDVEGYFSP